MNQDDELNEMFREGLTEPGHHAEYREADWDALEKMLDERKKKRGIIGLLPYIGSVAAVLLVVFAWLFFKPSATEIVKTPVAVNKNTPVDGTNAAAVKQPVPDKPEVAAESVAQPGMPDKNNDARIAQAKPAQKNAAVNRSYIASNQYRRKGNTNNSNRIANTHIRPEQPATEAVIAVVKPGKSTAEAETAANNPEKTNAATAFSPNTFVIDKPQTVKPETTADTAGIVKQKAEIAKATKPEVKKTAAAPVRLALTVMAATNMNGVGSFTQTQAGANVGLLFSVGKGKFTLSTGAVYAKVPYGTEFSNYHTGYYFTTRPEYVNADCRVLDIPVYLHYQVYGNVKNKLSAGVGLSSYLMLKENYTYTYANPATIGPEGYSVSNRNKHYFGVFDVGVLYQRRLNPKFSLDLQPYLQLPMTDIGYGKVKLQSAGIAVGFSWNIK
ncbi:hypothetical protein ACFGVR_13230 [Mucilaginibacter sp. AW1-3]